MKNSMFQIKFSIEGFRFNKMCHVIVSYSTFKSKLKQLKLTSCGDVPLKLTIYKKLEKHSRAQC